MSLTAMRSLNDYNVTINYNNEKAPETRIYHYNDTLTLENPTKVNYKFLNWEDENHAIVTFPYKIKDNVTLNAVYTNEVIIHFDTNGGNPVDNQKIIINGDVNSLPVPTHTSGEFLGWFYHNEGNVTEVKAPFKNTFIDDFTLVAHWKLTAKDYKYEVLPDGNVKLLTYIGKDSNVVVPSIIDNKEVTTLGTTTFKENKSIVNVVLPDSIKTLEDESFLNCTSLTSIEFGTNIANYGERALIGCDTLTTITIPTNVKLIKLFEYDYLKIPNKLINIKIKYIEEINDYSGITTNLLSNLGNRLFDVELLEGFNVATGFKECMNVRSVVIKEGAQQISNSAFDNCRYLQSIDIPNSVTSIGESVFSGCESLLSLSIPDKVTKIDRYTISHCKSLTSITLPNSITSIEPYAFNYCTNLKLVILPNSIENIGFYAFDQCQMLYTLILPNSIKNIGEAAFRDCSLGDIYYSGTEAEFNNINIGTNNIDFYYGRLHSNCSLNDTHLFKDNNFNYFKTDNNEIILLECLNKNIEDVDLNTYFSGLKVISLANNCFYKCTKLKSIILPDTVSCIGDYAFAYCSSLATIKIPNLVTRIEEYTFYCAGLVSIIIPSSVTMIDDRAFDSNTCLSDVYYYGTAEDFSKINLGLFNKYLTDANFHYQTNVNDIKRYEDANFLYTKNNLNEVILIRCLNNNIETVDLNTYFGDAKVVGIIHNAFSEKANLKSITLPNTLKYIGEYAFYNCNSLTSIEIPTSITRLERSTFEECNALQSVTLPNTLTYIGISVFRSCDVLKEVFIPASVTTLDMCVFQYSGVTNIYCEAASKPEGWDKSWNVNCHATIQWGYKPV